MREQLIRYVELLFAGTTGCGDVQQEILQNTLDRYDDLIRQGKPPESAYRLAIIGIGDIGEILGEQSAPRTVPEPPAAPAAERPLWKRICRAIAIGLYILCPTPLFVLQDETGLCGLLCFVAVATVLIILSAGGRKTENSGSGDFPPDENRSLRQAVKNVVWAAAVCVYFILSFATHGWYITWVVFPMTACVQGLIMACLDWKEANCNEI